MIRELIQDLASLLAVTAFVVGVAVFLEAAI